MGVSSSPGLRVVPSGGTANKHRETQLQLQRKLQEREVIREQKRKLQVKILLFHIYHKYKTEACLRMALSVGAEIKTKIWIFKKLEGSKYFFLLVCIIPL